MGPEDSIVEQPFIAQLCAMGWTHVVGDVDNPAVTARSSFSEVLQVSVLRKKLQELNHRDGQAWLDDERLSEIIATLTRRTHAGVMEANQAATELIALGVTVAGLPDWDGERGQTVQFIDWDHPERNDFSVISQYRVDCPPGYQRGKAFIIPDLVLLVNGIPLVVVECKSPSVPEPLAQACDQLRRYHNQRFADGEVADNEGCEALFATNQLLIATSFDEARVGTIGSRLEHFSRWKTVCPAQETAVEQQLGVERLSEQQRLIAGMLNKQNLLDIIRHFILFMQVGGQTVKTVCRYQQFRAVQVSLDRLLTGKTRQQDGEMDRRGGIIWHTQGSGKSLTMVFLVRKLRTHPILRRFKVVVVTDRKDLQRQLSATATLTGEIVDVATTATAFKQKVKQHGPGLLFATIQKQRDPDTADEPGLTAAELTEITQTPTPLSNKVHEPVDEYVAESLNDDETILVLVDEAHRTQAGDLHAKLVASLPNCARIGFTGTPIIMGDKKRTHAIFGEFIDRYTIKESEDDGATVPFLYEGRTARGAIKDDANLDELFEDLFREHSRDELEAIKTKYATTGTIVEAPLMIAAKADDLLRHYVSHILPNGFKAQVVASSRRAAMRYVAALTVARDHLLTEAQALSPTDRALDDEALCQRPAAVRAVVQAWRQRDVLQALEFAAVISGSNNDDPAWKEWTDSKANEQRVKRFKKPLGTAQTEKTDPLAFLVVKSMLLTGFDAPIAGVMYLDRPIREAELLQAIARVNRTGFGKKVGIVVDYYGVAHHLQDALRVYADQDVNGALASLRDEIPALRDQHQRVLALFHSRRIESIDDQESCLEVLADERLRAEFTVKLKQFLSSLDVVLPRPEALPFTADAKKLAYLYARARNRYKDTPVLGKDVGAKVSKLIDDHVVCLGIDPKVPPIQLGDAYFEKHLSQQKNERAIASEMEHAIRHHITKHLDEDPLLYQRFSERLHDLLARLGEKWDEVVAALREILNELQTGKPDHQVPLAGLPEAYAPFLRTLLFIAGGGKGGGGGGGNEHAFGGDDDDQFSDADLVKLRNLTERLVLMIIAEITENFWEPHKLPAQEALGTKLFKAIRAAKIVDDDQAKALRDRFIELARANHQKLLQS